MAMIRKAALVMATVIAASSLLSGCDTKKSDGGDMDLNLKALDLQHIQYETSGYSNPTESKTVSVTIQNETITQGKKGVMVGKPCIVTVKNSAAAADCYYIVDWGDGTWSYNGPVTKDQSINLEHTYKKAGTYDMRSMSVEVQSGKKSGFGPAKTVEAMGDDVTADYLNKVEAISSESESDAYAAKNILDNDNATFWKSKTAFISKTEQWVGLRLDTFYRLDTLEVKVPKEAGNFPESLTVEYTTDGGATWYDLPKYYYVTPVHEGTFNPLMGFPNPAGATLVFNLDGIVANGIRVCSKLYAVGEPKEKYFAVSEMRVTGDQETLYYSSYGGQFDADLNNMYSIYGSAQTEVRYNTQGFGDSRGPYEGASPMMGNAEWYEWDGLKHIWTDNDALSTYSNRLLNTPVGNDTQGNYGYVMLSVDGIVRHLGHQSHYAQNATFIIAVRNYLLQRNNKVNVLSVKDSKYNKSMIDRLNDAMTYQLEVMDGKNGLLVIGDPENDGTATGNASTYWDAFTADGYISTYCNTLFYGSLLAMAEIETYQGNADKAAYYTALAATVRDNMNEKLWDADKGRYIMSIDKNGNKHDFGTTFTNFNAVAYGVATEEQAKRIYEWLDGDRVIEGDTSTGEDIYGAWKFAARTNTADIITEGPPYYFETWGEGTMEGVGALDPRPGGNGAYGRNVQNGGGVFYPQYYDMMGRIAQIGADSAMERLKVIMEEFHKDQLRTRRFDSEGYFAMGVICEFPESGIVPLVFQNGFIGLETGVDGLTIHPSLPADMAYAGVREYRYNGKVYAIEASKEAREATVEEKDGVFHVTVPADGTFILKLDNTVAKA